MPTFQCGKFRVWFGTDDAPAPIGSVPRGGEYAVRVGVLPRDADIVLRIRYRRQGGTWMFLPAGALPGADGEGPQFYEGIFRDLAPGAVIEYTVQCQHHGQLIEATDSTTVSFEIEKVGRTTRSSIGSSLRSTAAAPAGLERPIVPPTLARLSGDVTRRVVEEIPEAPPVDEGVASEPPVAEAARAAIAMSERAAGVPFLTAIPAVLVPAVLKQPDPEPLTIKATFAIFTHDPNLKISPRDFYFYGLSAEVSGLPPAGFQVLRHSFENDLKVNCTVPLEDSTPVTYMKAAIPSEGDLPRHFCSTPIEFPKGPFVTRTRTPASVRVIVKSFEGARVWSKEYPADDPQLGNLYIEVPLQRPIVLTSSAKRPRSANDKKLRGQVLELSKKCKLKDLTVMIQAKRPGDADWRIVAAGKTDGAGNFSLPYPFGVFVEAQAVVSATPEHPAAIRVTEVRSGNETIAEDFLYLLLKDFDCVPDEEEADCECDEKKHPARLPDQADLIGSDEYTQDIGGSCVNLSTPNRTLSEFNYKAIVRTSDPDVANYTLTRVETVKPAGIDPVRKLEISRALSALDAGLRNATLHNALPPAILSAASSQVSALRALIEHNANADITVALKGLDAFIAGLISSLAQHHTNTPAPEGTGSSSVSPATIDTEITRVVADVVLNRPAAPPIGPDPDALDWDTLEGAIRQAVINAGGALLTPTFFFQFPGWRVGDAGAAYQSALLRDVTLKAAAAAAGGDIASSGTGAIALPTPSGNAVSYVLALANDLKANLNAAQLVRVETSYELFNGAKKRLRERVDLDNLVAWQDDNASMTLFQAVTVATGHVLHYKSEFKADGYSLGDVVYSLPLAPGQKKEIVIIDASHRLMGTESQTVSQAERLAAGIFDERTILSGLGGRISETLRGESSANTSGISAGFGTAGQGSGGGQGYGGSGGAVIGVAGGVANANSSAWADSSRSISEHFEETLRQSIMQNADAYRQLNASVVTTVEEGQRYGVTSEVVANHNHCHALTIMYFEVLRHYAIFQRLSSVEECVFVPLLMTNFTALNIYKWRDVLAQSLLPVPADTSLQSLSTAMPYSPRQHPLLRAFDANERVQTGYANVDFPVGAYNDETIQFIRGSMRIRVELPRPRTRFDRIMSLPVTKQVDAAALAGAVKQFASDSASYSAKAAFTAGIWTAFEKPPMPPNHLEYEVLATEAISDAFMSMDANFQSVPPAQSMRIHNFKPQPISFGTFPIPFVPIVSPSGFFADNLDDRKQWEAYSQILGYSDVETMLDAYFKGNLIAEWDAIFYTDIAPLVFEKIISRISLSEFSTDFSSDTKYKGGERAIRLNVTGGASKKRNQLPLELKLSINDPNFKKLQNYITFSVEDLTITYSTAHFNGVLYSGNVNDDLFDDTSLYIPENSEEKRNPRKDDAHLVYKLIEHLNSHIEHYNKALWFNLDADRRYMLLDGFDIPIFNDYGLPIGRRSLASVVKNELVTITGNSLVLPVAAGYRVSQSYIVEESADGVEVVSLLDHYQPLTPVEPYRISVPTKGVFAEAMQGACNACEKIETDRLQDWTKFPNTDEPTAISPVVVPTPSVADWKAAFKDLAPPMVNIQNAPAAPAPGAGLEGLSDALTKSGVFKDVTGLEGNQQNVIRTYQSNQENAKAFGEMAKDLAMQQHNTQNSGKIMDQIKTAKDSKAINQQEAGDLVKGHLQQQIDGGATRRAELDSQKQSAPSPLSKAAMDAVGQGRNVKIQREGDRESVDISKGWESEAATEILRKIPGGSITSVETGETKVLAAGESVSATTKTDSEMLAAEIGWEHQNPAGRADLVDDELLLWNFKVGGVQLKSEHMHALDNLTAISFIAGEHSPDITYAVDGRASDTGEVGHNRELARRRSEAVVAYLVGHRRVPRANIFPSSTETAPAPQSTETGESRARNRAVSVIKLLPSTTVVRPGPGPGVGPTPPPPTPDHQFPITFGYKLEGLPIPTPSIVAQFSFNGEVSGQLVAPNVDMSALTVEQTHTIRDSASVEVKFQINSFFAAKVEAGISKNDREGKFDPTLSITGEFEIYDQNKLIVGLQGDAIVPVTVAWENTIAGVTFKTSVGTAKVDIVGTFTLALGPGPATAAAFWTGAGPVAGLAIGTAAFWIIFFEAFHEAEQKGQRVRRNSSRRVGFAAGIAAMLEDEFEQRNIDDYANGYGGVDRVWFLEGVDRAYFEMQKGATAEREARRRDLQARFAPPDANGVRPHFKTITDNVMRGLGGFDDLDRDDELSLP